MYAYYAKVRDSKGLTDFAVSKMTGISSGTISDWKSGRIQNLKSDKLQKIADALGVSVDYLLTGKDTEKESITNEKYYFSDETAAIAQELFDNPDLRALLDAGRGARPEHIHLAEEMLKKFKETNPDG